MVNIFFQVEALRRFENHLYFLLKWNCALSSTIVVFSETVLMEKSKSPKIMDMKKVEKYIIFNRSTN